MPNQKIKKLFLLVVVTMFFVGCGGPHAQQKDVFTVGLEGNPTNLDPRFSTDAYSSRIRPLLFDSLFEVAPEGTFTPGLAESWHSDDGLVYTFKLRKGVRFHDDTPLTSRDVKYTFDYIRNPDNKCPSASSLEKLESVETPDEHTVVFKLSEVFVPILFKLVKGIVPAHLGDEEDFSDNPVGSGPFRLVGFQRGEKIRLAANENYFMGAPNIKNVLFEVVRSDTTRLLRLEKGELHLVQNAIPPYSVKFFKRKKHLQVIRAPGINYSYLGFNLKDQKGITDKLLVRRAIAHSIDRTKIVDALLKGQAKEATGLLAPSNWAYNQDVMQYEYNLEKAKKLLDEAGFSDPDDEGPKTRFTLSYKTSTNKLRNRIAEVMAVQFRKVGIGLEKRSYEWGTFFDDIKKGNFQTYTLSWVGITDPDIFHYIFHSKSQPPSGANRGRYENADMDRLIDQSRIEVDREKRREIFCQIQEIFARDCVYVSLWWADNIIVAAKNLKGFAVYPGGEYSSLATATWEPER